MNSTKIFGKGIAFPPRVDGSGRLAWSQGEDNVMESLRILLTTDPGERVNLPAFGAGLGQFLFSPNTVATRTLIARAIEQSIARWETRVKLESVVVEPDVSDPAAARATLEFRLVATQALQRLTLAISTSGQVPA